MTSAVIAFLIGFVVGMLLHGTIMAWYDRAHDGLLGKIHAKLDEIKEKL